MKINEREFKKGKSKKPKVGSLKRATNVDKSLSRPIPRKKKR